MTDRPAAFHLASVLIWRSYREQRAKLVLLPLAFASLIALVLASVATGLTVLGRWFRLAALLES
ncbi:MAG: hypothetical protein QN122_07590 [Armatimonadota bacterium]|nr:hypothetical protein [Armatimonadota bacterium]MDR7449293.1 hypothetical protein [Armatimonadota bacterium]MDR7459643.1 hypothetical protein [Armatimonadota bacterium]MDR7480583.1 hypothetical protein [Armatimonadota bacterium]MDR7489279.1 hypothetical protein [Armatimonadota bacterium]